MQQRVPKRKFDINILFFVLNIALVLIGYGLANLTDKASLTPMKLSRIVVLGISIIFLFVSKKNYHYIFKGKNSWIIWIFIIINIYVLPFSVNFFVSLEKFVNLIPYFFYLNYFIVYLYRIYDREHILNFIIISFNIIYLLPVVSFFISGGGFDHEDIYGEVVGGFVSNHYGWSCILFLATSIDILRNKSSLSVKRRILIILCCLIAVYILAISGSRSAYLSFAVCFILFILKNKSTSFAIKILSTIAAIGFILNLYSDRDSALNKRFQKTETQLEKGDARSAIYDLGFVTMADNPVTLITGFGFYTPAEAMLILNKNANKKVLEVYSLHNSYLELLFGSGLFIFAFFLVFFVGNTVWCFTIRHSSRYIFLPPILLIPFFENNFNPGQFLFFPWFIIMLYYIHYNERQIKIEDNLNMHFIPKKNVFL